MTQCCPVFIQHAHALEILSDKLMDGASALDVGSGSGYLTACFARMVSSRIDQYEYFTIIIFVIFPYSHLRLLPSVGRALRESSRD